MIPLTKKTLCVPLLMLLLACAGCFQKEFKDFEYALETETARELYNPLMGGQQALLENLESVSFDTLFFSFSGKILTQKHGPVSEEDLLNEANIIFFLAEDQYHYFNPRKLRLEPLSQILKGNAPGILGSDILETGSGSFTVIRSMARPATLLDKEYDRDLFRIDFQLLQNTITFDNIAPLTKGEEIDFMPEPFPERRQIYFLRRVEDSRNRLMVLDLESNAVQPVFATQDFDIKYPTRLTDGRLACSADKDGYFKIYTVSFPGNSAPGATNEAALLPLEPPYPLQEENATRLTLVSVGGEEGQPPTFSLVKLPIRYDLKTLSAVVSAHNPQINRKRALFAATLIQSKQARFRNWPILDWGLFYTPEVGVFLDDPLVYSGDFLAEGISRGLLGIAQPLLDFRKNYAHEQAELFRARLAHDDVLNEVNERLAEAAELYFEAHHMKRLMQFDKDLEDVMQRRLNFYQRLREKSEASLEEVLAAEQLIAGIASEKDYHSQRFLFLISRLKEICGLPENATFILHDEEFGFQDVSLGPFERLRHTALLHHPRLKAARDTLLRSFYLEKTGPEQGPSAFFSATYGQSRRHFNDPVDDYISLTLQGKYPLSSLKNAKEQKNYWSEMRQAYLLAREAQSRQVATALEEALMDFRAAQNDYIAKRKSLLYRLESLRVAELYEEYGAPGEKELSPQNLSTVSQEYLEALAKLSKTKMDLGLRYAKVWRELGLADRLAEETMGWQKPARKKMQPSLWLWETKEVTRSDATIRDFINFCKKHDISRVYAYLYSESTLLTKREEREKIKIFLNFCNAADIEVWGLLGEPEWLEASGSTSIRSALTRLLEFNRAQRLGQPKFSGIKLDLEPHSQPGWHSDAERRAFLTGAYRIILEEASTTLSGLLPIWLDIPPLYFNTDHKEMADLVARYSDGATLMCYFRDPKKIETTSRQALKSYPRKLEIGLELSSKALATDRLPVLTYEAFQKLILDLTGEGAMEDNFSGLAFHDYSGAVEYFSTLPHTVQ